ncbi:MAG TPA: GAF domain-containing protein [Chloroflexota bacterium]|nr:GAF domain-containing protein [Chloroflexota bacterium]
MSAVRTASSAFVFPEASTEIEDDQRPSSHLPALRQEQAQILMRTLAHVGAAHSLETALRALLAGSISVLQGQEGVVRALLSDGSTLSLRLRSDGTDAPVLSPSPQKGSFGAALLAGGPSVLVHDFWALDPQTYFAYDEMRSQGLRSSVAVPIDGGGQRLGSLHITHRSREFFTHEDLLIAEALATLAGAAILRVRLEAERRQADEARARLDGALLVTRTVAHEINNALSPVVGFAELLAERPSVSSDPTAKLYANLISTSAHEAADKVIQLQRIVRLEETPSVLGPDMPLLDLDRSTRKP